MDGVEDMRMNMHANTLPVDERALFRQRWQRAHECGWRKLGLWAGGIVPEQDDLFGIPPWSKYLCQVPLRVDDILPLCQVPGNEPRFGQ